MVRLLWRPDPPDATPRLDGCSMVDQKCSTPRDARAVIGNAIGVQCLYAIGKESDGALYAAKWVFSSCRIDARRSTAHVLAYRTAGDATITRRVSGTSVRKKPVVGSVSFTPADEGPGWSSEGSSESLHLYIPQARFERIACENASIPAAVHGFFGVVDPWLDGLFRMLISEFELFRMTGPEPEPLFLEQIEVLLVRHLLREFAGSGITRAPHNGPGHPLRNSELHKVLDYIAAHLAGDIRLQNLADLVHMSAGHFLRRFATTSGTTPHRYVQEQRLQKARALLQSTTDSVATVALQCGFKSPAHLSTRFCGRFGLTPSRFRVRTRSGINACSAGS